MYLELTEVNSNLAGIIAPLLLGAAAAGYLASAGRRRGRRAARPVRPGQGLRGRQHRRRVAAAGSRSAWPPPPSPPSRSRQLGGHGRDVVADAPAAPPPRRPRPSRRGRRRAAVHARAAPAPRAPPTAGPDADPRPRARRPARRPRARPRPRCRAAARTPAESHRRAHRRAHRRSTDARRPRPTAPPTTPTDARPTPPTGPPTERARCPTGWSGAARVRRRRRHRRRQRARTCGPTTSWTSPWTPTRPRSPSPARRDLRAWLGPRHVTCAPGVGRCAAAATAVATDGPRRLHRAPCRWTSPATWSRTTSRSPSASRVARLAQWRRRTFRPEPHPGVRLRGTACWRLARAHRWPATSTTTTSPPPPRCPPRVHGLRYRRRRAPRASGRRSATAARRRGRRRRPDLPGRRGTATPSPCRGRADRWPPPTARTVRSRRSTTFDDPTPRRAPRRCRCRRARTWRSTCTSFSANPDRNGLVEVAGHAHRGPARPGPRHLPRSATAPRSPAPATRPAAPPAAPR